MQKMRKKRSKWDLSRGCITQQHRYNTRYSSLEEEGCGIDALLRRTHRYIHVPSVYIHLWQASWLSNLVGFVEAWPSPFFFSFFSNLSPSKSAVRFFASPVSGINSFRKIFSHLVRYNLCGWRKTKAPWVISRLERNSLRNSRWKV